MVCEVCMVAQLNRSFTIQPIWPGVFFCPVEWTQCLIISFRSAPIAATSKSQILQSCVVMRFPDNLETSRRFSCGTVKNRNVTRVPVIYTIYFFKYPGVGHRPSRPPRWRLWTTGKNSHSTSFSICIWKFLAAHPSEGQSCLLSTHVLNTAQHWLKMPVIFAACVVYWLHLAF